MKKGDIIRLSIDDLNNLGSGVGRAEDGRVVFVRGAVTGDIVEAKIIKVNSKYYVGRLEKLVEPSKNRAEERFCDAPEACGGCIYRHITYAHELELKRNYVENAFRKSGLPEVTVDPVLSAGELCGYRNKAQFPVRSVKGHATAGFFAVKTHDLIPLSNCPLQPPVFSEIARTVCEMVDERGIAAYDEEKGTGILRHIYIRLGEATGEIMICLVVNGEHHALNAELAGALVEKFPATVSVMLNFNRKITNEILGDEYRCLFGRDHITDMLGGMRFNIRADAFWQVNHKGAELLYAEARRRADMHGGTLLDLYCGTGSIGLTMAKDADRIVGIEITPAAVECAKENAEQNGIANAEFYCGDASDSEGIIASAERITGKIDADVVVLDPPRKGSTPELINYLAAREIKRIVYVSCDPVTLARDCKLFAELGYLIGNVTPVDMFPRTGHVETVALLSRKKTEHQMKLNQQPFEMIKSGQKTIELRLNDEKRQKLKVGDEITFTNTANGETLKRTVLKLHPFNSFYELYRSLPLLKCGYTELDIHTAQASDMEKYYSVEEQAKYGVVGIELCRPKQITDESVLSLTRGFSD